VLSGKLGKNIPFPAFFSTKGGAGRKRKVLPPSGISKILSATVKGKFLFSPQVVTEGREKVLVVPRGSATIRGERENRSF